MNLLFVHNGFPGQYTHLLKLLTREGGHRLVGIGHSRKPSQVPKGMTYIPYQISRSNASGVHPYAHDLETKVIRASACAETAVQLRDQGFQPDLICAHPGWGEALFLKDVWPAARLLCYQEFFYQAEGLDVDFDPEFQDEQGWPERARIRAKSANVLMNLEASDWNVTPTQFQQSCFPEHWRRRISVIHDGINTTAAQPNPDVGPLTLPGGHTLQPGEQVVTFINRSLEPYRGCHTFLRALPELQQLAPEARVVVVGRGKGVSYGAVCPQGEWKDRFLQEIEGRYDPSRVLFTGQVPYPTLLHLLQLSRCHVYLTYPFVLSWSLLEAMSCGCAVVGSATAPVQEVIRDGHNGVLVNFFSPNQLACAIADMLRSPERAKSLGQAARQTVTQHYSLQRCLPIHRALLELVCNGTLSAMS